MPHVLALALALAAAPPLPSRVPAPSPFPPPRSAERSDRLRCDTGTVIAAGGATLRVRTPAGAVAYRVAPDAPVLDREGRPASLPSLRPGERVRVYYVLDGGPVAVEIDLE